MAEAIFRILGRTNPSPLIQSPLAARDLALQLADRTEKFAVAIYARLFAVSATTTWSLPVTLAVVDAAGKLAADLTRNFQYADATKTAIKALEWNQTLEQPRLSTEWEVETCRIKALALHYDGKFPESMKEIQHAARLSNAAGVPSERQQQCIIDLAWIAFRMGDLRQSEQALKGMLDRISLTGLKNRSQILAAKNMLALIRGRRGDLVGAQQELEYVIRDAQELPGFDDATLFIYKANLATLWGRSGNYEEAVRRLDELLEDYRQLGYDINHPQTYDVQLNRFTWLASSGETDTAINGLEDLAERIRLAGAERSLEWFAVYWMLTSLRASVFGTKTLPDLRSLQRRAVAALGRSHTISLNVRLETTKWLIVAGRSKRAARNLRRIADDARQAEVWELVQVARILRVFGLWQAHQNEQAITELESLALEGPLAETRSGAYGFDQRELLTQIYTDILDWAVSTLASLWNSSGGSISEEHISYHSLYALRTNPGPVPMFLSGSTSRTMLDDLAEIFQETPVPEKLLHVADSQRMREQVPEPGKAIPAAEQQQIDAARVAARIARESGRHVEALQEYERVARILARYLPDRHPKLLTALSNAALACGDAGNKSRSLRMLKQIAAIEVQVCGQFNFGTVLTLHNLAWTTYELGRYSEAFRIFENLAFPAFWVFGWSEHLANWAVSLADCRYFDGQAACALAHLAGVTRASESFTASGFHVADRCRGAAQNISTHYASTITQITSRMTNACRQLLGSHPFQEKWKVHLQCAEYLALLGLSEDADTYFREASACDNSALRKDAHAVLLATLLHASEEGDEEHPEAPTIDSIPEHPLVSLARPTRQNKLERTLRTVSRITTADLDFPLAYLVWSDSISLVLSEIEKLDHELKALYEQADAQYSSVFIVRHRRQILATKVDSILRSLLRTVGEVDTRTDISAAVEWRCLEGLTLCAITDIATAASAKYTAEMRDFGSDDPRTLESAALAAAASAGAEGLNPLRDVLRNRIEESLQSNAWQAMDLLRSFIETRLAETLLLADSGSDAQAAEAEQATKTSSSLFMEWISLVALDLDVRAKQGIDPRQAYGLVAHAFAFMSKQGLSQLAGHLRDSFRHRIESWASDGGILELVETFTSALQSD
jgi:tetratricopeptide (TPR) repeat protein